MKTICLKRVLFLCFSLFVCVTISSCGKHKTLPDTMPEDFDFSFQYGFEKKNEINTYNNSLTKDLIQLGQKAVSYDISKEDKEKIYDEVVKLHLADIKKYLKNKNRGINPLSEYEFTFTVNDKKYTVAGDQTMYSLYSKESTNFISFINYMKEFTEATKEYQNLPKAVGGYD